MKIQNDNPIKKISKKFIILIYNSLKQKAQMNFIFTEREETFKRFEKDYLFSFRSLLNSLRSNCYYEILRKIPINQK